MSGLKARDRWRDAPGKVLKDRRSPRRRDRMGTSVRISTPTNLPRRVLDVRQPRRDASRLVHGHLLDAAPAQHFQPVSLDEALRERANQRRRHRPSRDPPNVERVLMRERVVVQELHRDRGAELLGGFEQPHEQRRADEVVHETFTQPHAYEQVVRGHSIVRAKRRVVSPEVERGVQEADHGRAVAQGQATEVIERREDLPERRGESRELARAEHRRGRLQTVRGEEARRGERREDVLLSHPSLREHRFDVRVVLPEPARAVLERLPRRRRRRRRSRGVRDAVEEGHVASSLAERFRRAEAAPSRADDRDLRFAIFARRRSVVFRRRRRGRRRTRRADARDGARMRRGAAGSLGPRRRNARARRERGRGAHDVGRATRSARASRGSAPRTPAARRVISDPRAPRDLALLDAPLRSLAARERHAARVVVDERARAARRRRGGSRVVAATTLRARCVVVVVVTLRATHCARKVVAGRPRVRVAVRQARDLGRGARGVRARGGRHRGRILRHDVVRPVRGPQAGARAAGARDGRRARRRGRRRREARRGGSARARVGARRGRVPDDAVAARGRGGAPAGGVAARERARAAHGDALARRGGGGIFARGAAEVVRADAAGADGDGVGVARGAGDVDMTTAADASRRSFATRERETCCKSTRTRDQIALCYNSFNSATRRFLERRVGKTGARAGAPPSPSPTSRTCTRRRRHRAAARRRSQPPPATPR
eukprot:17224-Pelagococcus_subviridis.AAC.3